MDANYDHLVKDAAKVLRPRERGESQIVERKQLDTILRELASMDELEPRQAASQVARLLQVPESAPRKPSSRWVRIILSGILAVILIHSVALGVLIFQMVWGQPVNEPVNDSETVLTDPHSESSPIFVTLAQGKMSLYANGEDESNIQVFVRDQFGEPIQDPVDVTFRADPDQLGTVDPASTETMDGLGEAVFKASTVSGKAQVVVSVNGQPEGEVIFYLLSPPAESPGAEEPSNLLLSVTVDANQEQEVHSGSPFVLTFTIRNQGSTIASTVVFHVKLPSDIEPVLPLGESVYDETERTVVWRVGDLDPGSHIEQALELQVSETASSGKRIANYWLEDSSGQETAGQNQLSLVVIEREAGTLEFSGFYKETTWQIGLEGAQLLLFRAANPGDTGEKIGEAVFSQEDGGFVLVDANPMDQAFYQICAVPPEGYSMQPETLEPPELWQISTVEYPDHGCTVGRVVETDTPFDRDGDDSLVFQEKLQQIVVLAEDAQRSVTDGWIQVLKDEELGEQKSPVSFYYTTIDPAKAYEVIWEVVVPAGSYDVYVWPGIGGHGQANVEYSINDDSGNLLIDHSFNQQAATDWIKFDNPLEIQASQRIYVKLMLDSATNQAKEVSVGPVRFEPRH